MSLAICDCGMPIHEPSEEMGCIECSSPCCPACAFVLESAAYCARCAGALLEAPWGPSAADDRAA